MKIIAILIFGLLPALLWADMGSSVVYRAKYVLKNGTSITGQVAISGYDDYAYLDANNSNKYCGDKEFQQLINHYFYELYRQLSFTVYQRIELIKFDASAKIFEFLPSAIPYTDSSSAVSLRLDDIKYTVFLSAKRSSWGASPINVVSDSTFEFLKAHQAYREIEILNPYDSNYFEYGGGALLLDFNKKNTQKTIRKTSEQFGKEIFSPKLKSQEKRKQLLQKYLNQGYFFVEWGGGC